MTVPVLLGEPLRVGRLELRNRVVSPPMERNNGTLDVPRHLGPAPGGWRTVVVGEAAQAASAAEAIRQGAAISF